jgi:hypothetical protein
MRFFPDIRKFAWDSKKSEKWNTTVQRSGSGKVRTLTNQLLPSWTIEASYKALTDDEARELLGFVALIKGAHEPFYWLDPEDYECKGQVLAPISSTQYQAVMQMGGYVEAVEYIDNVTVYVNGGRVTNYTVDGGVIKFSSAPSGTVTADYRYYWKVMLPDDGFKIEKIYRNINKASFKLEVVR